MRAFSLIAILAMTALLAAPPAQACSIAAPLQMDLIERADAVVVGRLSHYERIINRANGVYYARFRITVHQTLRGETPRTITVRWHNSTFALRRSMAPGEYLVALYADGEGRFTVLQGMCSPPLLFEANSEHARAARRQLAEQRARRR